MTFDEVFYKSPVVLMEGALGLRLRNEYGLLPHPTLAFGDMVYREAGRAALSKLLSEYRVAATDYNLPFMATTPMRRVNRDTAPNQTIYDDNVAFLRDIALKPGAPMYIGGLMGCKGDAYTGAGALNEADAQAFHAFSANAFAKAGADFHYAGIMPTLNEAVGMARAMGDTGLPYIISLMIREDGCMIDGTSIHDAIVVIDRVLPQPLCIMTNCVHPDIARQALLQPFNRTQEVNARFRGIQSNASKLPHDQLDGVREVHSSSPDELAAAVMRLNEIAALKIIGGCCGTDDRHIRRIAEVISATI